MNSHDRLGNPMTNYRLRDGDVVELRVPVRISGYVYDPDYAPYGDWTAGHMLAGVRGVVKHARTPCVTSVRGRTCYFANVDIEHNGQVTRVRPFHFEIKRVGSL